MRRAWCLRWSTLRVGPKTRTCPQRPWVGHVIPSGGTRSARAARRRGRARTRRALRGASSNARRRARRRESDWDVVRWRLMQFDGLPVAAGGTNCTASRCFQQSSDDGKDGTFIIRSLPLVLHFEIPAYFRVETSVTRGGLECPSSESASARAASAANLGFFGFPIKCGRKSDVSRLLSCNLAVDAWELPVGSGGTPQNHS